VYKRQGKELKPIILTAKKRAQKLLVRCPSCQQEHPIHETQLGHETSCPTPGCGLQLKINPFVIQMD
jgi:hypothetical protein